MKTNKIKVGILGATGVIGQNYIRLLENHPWFEISHVAASPRSAGISYEAAVTGRWHMHTAIPNGVRKLTVNDANDVSQALEKCRLVFSAVEMEKSAVAGLEMEYASSGFAVVSNNSAHRFTEDIPMIIPEVNPHHLDIIPYQQKQRGWEEGFIVVKSNCSIQSYMAPLFALLQAGYTVPKMIITTMQAVSGAGYPGPSSMDLIDNVVPFINGEESKSENEPLKILGKIENNRIINHNRIKISAHCNRVPVTHGHTACVSLAFGDEKPEQEEILKLWREFRSIPQELNLPSAPEHPIIYREEVDRPQPKKDRDAEKSMAVSVGRLRKCHVFDIRFIGLHHNTVRGAAGGAILTAELLKAKGYLRTRRILMSFFTFERVAKGYAKYRPYYHPLIMEKIRSCTRLQGKFKNALDVGCGTGLSSSALQEIAEEVKGTDSSAEMIGVARNENKNNIPFFNAPAENLPFENQSFDLLTVCGAINWIDRTQFFPEANRVLNNKGWMIIYDNFITDEMPGNSGYTKWYQDSYLTRYPKPPRDESPLTETECNSHDFSLVKNESYSNERTLSIDQYIGFIMTQSNVINAIDSGREDTATTKTWMQSTLKPLFPKDEGTFIFRGFIWYLQCA